MSNPTEPPDLDRLERCATKGAHVSRDEFLALIALARRAQPEGEAPQADPHRATIEEAAQVLESAAAHNRAKGRTVLERTQQDRADRLRAILTAPSIDGLPRYKLVSGDQREWMAPAADGAWCRFNHAAALLAAQSQGAQAAMRKCSKFGHRCNCATDCDPDKPHPSLAAQQAAAPGALDADEMTRLRRLMRALGMADDGGNDEYVRGILFTVLGQAADQIERATLAAASISPGTPEAPGLPGQNDQEAYAGSGYRHFMSLDTFKAFRRECENRAAQLDGGQEGSESNG